MCGGSRASARFQRRPPLVEPLGRRAVDQVEVERREADPADRLDGADHVVRVVLATEQAEDPRHHRLHAEADPRDPTRGEDGQQLVGDVVGVALDGHLGAGDERQLAERGDELIRRNERRRATADEHRLHGPGLAGERLGRCPAARRRGSRRSDGADRSTWRTRSSRTASCRTGRGCTRRAATVGSAGALTISTAAATAAVSTRRTLPPSGNRRGRRPPAPSATNRLPGRRRSPSSGRCTGRPPGSATATSGSTSSAGCGPVISGNHTRRDCIDASAAMRRSRVSCRSSRSPVQRTTECSASSRTIRSIPTSVHLATSHSRRSPFGGATAIVSTGSGRCHRLHLAGHRDTVAGEHRGPPTSGSVGDRHRLAAAQAQHSRQGGARASLSSCGSSTSATSTWAAERRSASIIAFPGHAGRCLALARWRSLARTREQVRAPTGTPT